MLNMAAVISAVGCIIYSVLGIIFYDLYVLDLDDLLFVGSYFGCGMYSKYLLTISTLCLLFALSSGMLVLLPDIAGLMMCILSALSAIFLISTGIHVYIACDARAGSEYATKRRQTINDLIEEVYRENYRQSESS